MGLPQKILELWTRCNIYYHLYVSVTYSNCNQMLQLSKLLLKTVTKKVILIHYLCDDIDSRIFQRSGKYFDKGSMENPTKIWKNILMVITRNYKFDENEEYEARSEGSEEE
ncbi:hypothetical protein Glove_219g118 [Diversispora epigaea]|uniref:Uncharacterized protein n=1 Tax=Diversispora epigaea TaxID=1348612 RepID=A0A397IG05_9GLOM|nr:hypothetical protein Glove_219g118 [Diversispora epigaea]